jgi:hypothetical protein
MPWDFPSCREGKIKDNEGGEYRNACVRARQQGTER